MTKIKSTYEITMEKLSKMGIDDTPSLSEEQRNSIAKIRNEYEAKIAEKKILLKDTEELPGEISFLEREMARKIQNIKA
jgi:hypothetical protein